MLSELPDRERAETASGSENITLSSSTITQRPSAQTISYSGGGVTAVEGGRGGGERGGGEGEAARGRREVRRRGGEEKGVGEREGGGREKGEEGERRRRARRRERREVGGIFSIVE